MERRNLNDDRINIIVEPEFKHKVRLKAMAQKKTLTEVVISLLKEWVKK